jgi:antitoxin FitA
MGDLLLRQVDEQLIRRLKAKAEINGTSLQQEAKKALARGAPLTSEEKAAEFEALRRELGGFLKMKRSGAEIVREVREEEY